MIKSSNRISFVISALMLAASIGALLARPATKTADLGPPISLENMIPRQFGDWREDVRKSVQVVNPQTQELLDKLYSQILTRAYVNESGYRIMLSLVYGTDVRGRGSLQAHKPEVCYAAQGFNVERSEAGMLATAFGESIPVRRLFATMGAREEPLTYWFTVGDTTVKGRFEKRLVDLRYGLTGRIPDGLLFRISSIDGDLKRAHEQQDRFINQLLQSVSPADRARLTGLGAS